MWLNKMLVKKPSSIYWIQSLFDVVFIGFFSTGYKKGVTLFLVFFDDKKEQQKPRIFQMIVDVNKNSKVIGRWGNCYYLFK